MATEIWHLGEVVNVARAQEIVDTFKSAVEPVRGIVAPWNRPASEETLDTPVRDTLWGNLTSAGAECRWRCDGQRVSVSIVSEKNLDLAELKLIQDSVESELFNLRSRSTLMANPQLIVYSKSGVEFLTRMMIGE